MDMIRPRYRLAAVKEDNRGCIEHYSATFNDCDGHLLTHSAGRLYRTSHKNGTADQNKSIGLLDVLSKAGWGKTEAAGVGPVMSLLWHHQHSCYVLLTAATDSPGQVLLLSRELDLIPSLLIKDDSLLLEDASQPDTLQGYTAACFERSTGLIFCGTSGGVVTSLALEQTHHGGRKTVTPPPVDLHCPKP